MGGVAEDQEGHLEPKEVVEVDHILHQSPSEMEHEKVAQVSLATVLVTSYILGQESLYPFAPLRSWVKITRRG